MEFENLMDIIAFALQKEREAAAFYEQLSKEERRILKTSTGKIFQKKPPNTIWSGFPI
jgi:rubrerythrin